jgi:NTP pyrophosphatase (non-canonical NTP hydrolase)
MAKSKLNLNKNPTVKDFQKYVAEMIVERGFDKETVPEIFMMLLEECGEFARSARKTQEHIKAYKGKKRDGDMGLEAADVFIYLLQLCNHFGIDLEKSFREKEEINKKRIWK